MHTSMSNTYIILERVFQKYLSDPKCAHGLIDHVKKRKQASNCNWVEHYFHVQYNKDVQHKSLKIPYDST